jgi:hypothetical protein
MDHRLGRRDAQLFLSPEAAADYVRHRDGLYLYDEWGPVRPPRRPPY